LDVLIGHPEHDLLFVANQVMQASGLTHGKRNVQRYKDLMSERGQALQVRDIKGDDLSTLPNVVGVPRWADVWMFTEPAIYEVLLKAKSPKTEPFRRWVTEEVLPTIRKTGSYNAEAIVI
jgi:prophage antirepressor-like protein